MTQKEAVNEVLTELGGRSTNKLIYKHACRRRRIVVEQTDGGYGSWKTWQGKTIVQTNPKQPLPQRLYGIADPFQSVGCRHSACGLTDAEVLSLCQS